MRLVGSLGCSGQYVLPLRGLVVTRTRRMPGRLFLVRVRVCTSTGTERPSSERVQRDEGNGNRDRQKSPRDERGVALLFAGYLFRGGGGG